MTTRAEVVAEARRWVGTPFVHQGRVRGHGCDCGGLVGGIAVALGIVPADWWQIVFDPRFGGYGRQPANGVLEAVCESFMSAIDPDAAEPGDVLLMRFADEPQHLGIVADYRNGGLSIVHALSRVGSVVEHRLGGLWTWRIVGAYRMPGVA